VVAYAVVAGAGAAVVGAGAIVGAGVGATVGDIVLAYDEELATAACRASISSELTSCRFSMRSRKVLADIEETPRKTKSNTNENLAMIKKIKR